MEIKRYSYAALSNNPMTSVIWVDVYLEIWVGMQIFIGFGCDPRSSKVF